MTPTRPITTPTPPLPLCPIVDTPTPCAAAPAPAATDGTPTTHPTPRIRQRNARRLWVLRTIARDVPPPYEYEGDPEAPTLPDQDTLGHPLRARETTPVPIATFRALKPFPEVCIDTRRLHSFLQRTHQPRLLTAFQALTDLELFEKFYVDEEKVAAAPPARVRQVKLDDHLWQQAIDAGVMVSLGLHPVPIPITAPHRAVPDRKKPDLGRLVSPLMATNDRCRVPDPCPTPLIHIFIYTVLSRKYASSCDYKGWFYAIGIALKVSRIWFGAKKGKEFFALLRGLMGWTHTPWLMASLAQHIAATACMEADPTSQHRREVPSWLQRLQQPGNVSMDDIMSDFLSYDISQSDGGLLCPIWVDNIHFLCDDPELIAEAMRIHTKLTDHLGVVVHEASPISQHLDSVGLHMMLGDDPRWRVDDEWSTKWIATARTVDDMPSLPLRSLWSILGGSVWAGYASMYPFCWLRPGFDYLRVLAQRWQSRSIRLDDLVPYTSAVRDVVRSVATQLSKRTWRRLTVGMTHPGFSDAMVEPDRESRGFIVYVHGQWMSSATGALPPTRHINIAELHAIHECFCASTPAPRHAFPIGGDNTCSLWQLYRWSARNPAAEAILRLTYEEAATRQQSVAPFHLISEMEPADAPSRAMEPGMGIVDETDIIPAAKAMRYIGLPVHAIAELPAGWHSAPTTREFLSATCAARTP
jgi:hypothetical protein